MGGIELRENTLVVEREPNRLDELAIRFSAILDGLDIDHVFIAGYVSILTGRARSTEAIDVLLEVLDEKRVVELAETLDDAGFWGAAMPLESMYEMLSTGDNVWVAPTGQVTPDLELKFASDTFDTASLDNAITAEIGEESVPIGPLELQIAYKLYLGSETDLEDAVHFYTIFGETLSEGTLEHWVSRLGVEPAYERLKRA